MVVPIKAAEGHIVALEFHAVVGATCCFDGFINDQMRGHSGKWIDVRSSTLNIRGILAIRLKNGVFAILQSKKQNSLAKIQERLVQIGGVFRYML